MDLRQLRYFVGIVQSGSLSRAADQLHVAQSAISHHLASLESELDRQLVTRGPKGIQLTEAGSVLYRHAEAILRHLDFAKQDACKRAQCPFRACIDRISGRMDGIVGYELFARVRTHTSANPASCQRRQQRAATRTLVNGRLDIALLFTGQAERGLAVEPLLLGGTVLCHGGSR